MKKNKLSEQDIFAMLNEAASGTKVDEVCRKYKIANSTYYKLKTKYYRHTYTPKKRLILSVF